MTDYWKPYISATAIFILMLVLLFSWGTDYRSCQRQKEPRDHANLRADGIAGFFREAARIRRASGDVTVSIRYEGFARQVEASKDRTLHCGKLFPDT